MLSDRDPVLGGWGHTKSGKRDTPDFEQLVQLATRVDGAMAALSLHMRGGALAGRVTIMEPAKS